MLAEYRKWSIIFLVPAVLFLLFAYVYPMIYSLVMSFFSYSMLIPGAQPVFVGLNNYINIFSNQAFLNSLKITFIFSIAAIFFQFIIGLFLSVVLSANLRFTGLFRVCILIPLMMAPVVAGVLWRNLYHSSYGVINYFISFLGIPPQTWLGNASQALPAVIVVEIWQQLPVFTFILAAGIASVPNELYKAALVDGCGRWNIFWNITFPLIRPAMIVAFLLRIIDTLRVFDIVYTMTQGGPGTSTKLLSLHIYERGLKFFDIGNAAAQSWFFVIIVLIIEIYFIKLILRRGIGG
jgi:multiple sugar transport system permease protein